MRIVQNLNGLVELDSAELLEGYVEDNLAPVCTIFILFLIS